MLTDIQKKAIAKFRELNTPIPNRKDRRRIWKSFRIKTHKNAKEGMGTHSERRDNWRKIWGESVENRKQRHAKQRTELFKAMYDSENYLKEHETDV